MAQQTYQLVCIIIPELLMLQTREHIVQKNYEAIRKYGFQGLRTDKVIVELGITKGAFYHYFPDKMAIGYAVVDEIIAPRQIEIWENQLAQNGHAIDKIVQVLQSLISCTCQGEVLLGCPLNNLSQEMSYLDEGFRIRFETIVNKQIALITSCLLQDIETLQIEKTEVESLAKFIISSIEGSYSLSKILKNKQVFDGNIKQLQKQILILKKQTI